MSSSKRRKLAITVISGNEEKWVKQFVDSILPVADKVCVNLTQFDDNTEQLFREYVPKDKLILIKNKWESNFSLARNQCQKIVPEDIDYCMYVDLDEVLLPESYPVLESIMEDDRDALFLCTIYNALDNDTNSCASLYYPRLYPVKSVKGEKFNPQFQNVVHNQLVVDGDPPAVRVGVNIYHYGYALSEEEMTKKHDRTEALLRNQIKENNDTFFAHLNLAQLLRAKGDFYGTIKHALEVIRLVEPDIKKGTRKNEHAYLMAADQLGTAYLATHNLESALIWDMKALDIKSDYLDVILNLGNIFMEMNDLEQAEKWYKRYLFVRKVYSEHKDNTNLILNHLNSSFIALYNIGIIKGMQGKHKEANEYFEKSYKEEPEFKDIFIRILYSLRYMGEIEELNKRIGKFIDENPKKAYLIYEFLGDLAVEDGNIELAKFNYYQATYIGEIKDELKKKKIENKWFNLENIFGGIADTFFNTYDKQQEITNKKTNKVL